MTSGNGQQMNRNALLDIRGLTIDFWNRDRWMNVVNGIAFQVERGESFGLVGESGCGKSTTAYTLLGYRRPGSRIRAGSVQFDGQDLLKLRPAQLQAIRGKRISLVPQNPTTTLSPGMSVGKQILEVLNAHDVGEAATRQERVYDLLTHVRLPDPKATARKYPHQLSGGQQQRIVIAMAVACNPDLLVLDEPTTALDVTTQAQILELLMYLRAEHGMTLVYVTHDLGVLSLIADRVGVMYAGKLVEIAPVRELFRNPRHPYTRGLIASVPSVRRPGKRAALLKGFLQRAQLPRGCPFAPRCDFALERCFDEPQTLLTVGPNHAAACWRWADISEQPTEVIVAGDAEKALRSEQPLLDVTQIDVAYSPPRGFLARAQPRVVVKDVSFDIRPGETFALVGESGSGKSTIARSIAGLLKPLEGKITFEGQDISRLVAGRTREQRREIQLVFQNPDASLNPRQRVRQILGAPLEIFFGIKGAKQRQRVEQLLEDVRLDRSYADRYPDELSGGERQRIAIARALAAEPKLILCDEILSALDVSVQATVIELLRALQVERKIAYLFISHDLAVVRTLAHRLGVLYRGELCEVGTVEEVYAPPYHPYTHALFSAVPDVDANAQLAPAVRSEPPLGADAVHRACPFADRCPWKLGTICDEVAPPWQFTSETHGLRCHIPLAELRERETWSRPAREAAENAESLSLPTD